MSARLGVLILACSSALTSAAPRTDSRADGAVSRTVAAPGATRVTVSTTAMLTMDTMQNDVQRDSETRSVPKPALTVRIGHESTTTVIETRGTDPKDDRVRNELEAHGERAWWERSDAPTKESAKWSKADVVKPIAARDEGATWERLRQDLAAAFTVRATEITLSGTQTRLLLASTARGPRTVPSGLTRPETSAPGAQVQASMTTAWSVIPLSDWVDEIPKDAEYVVKLGAPPKPDSEARASTSRGSVTASLDAGPGLQARALSGIPADVEATYEHTAKLELRDITLQRDATNSDSYSIDGVLNIDERILLRAVKNRGTPEEKLREVNSTVSWSGDLHTVVEFRTLP